MALGIAAGPDVEGVRYGVGIYVDRLGTVADYDVEGGGDGFAHDVGTGDGGGCGSVRKRGDVDPVLTHSQIGYVF